jgi:uncharacterized protein YdhG (YjbR/CyaY superfamily)
MYYTTLTSVIIGSMSVVTDYLDRLNDVDKPALTRLRELVYELVPDAEDAVSYGVPTYRYKGKYMIGFASNKKFMSIYPGPEVIELLKSDLKTYKLSKGTISFTGNNPLPDDLLRSIIQLS